MGAVSSAPSYKSSVLANEARIIVAWDLAPSHEATVVPNLLDQAANFGTVGAALFDAGDHTDGVTATTDRGIELLCPAGRTLPDGDGVRPDDRPYSKSQFTYDAASNTYTSAQLARSSQPASIAKAKPHGAAHSSATAAMGLKKPSVRPWPTPNSSNAIANAKRWWNRSSVSFD